MPPWSRRRHRRKFLPFQLLDVFDYCPRDPPPARDWAELPLDAISYILRKLDQVELLKGGVAAVCSSWRRAARDEPELWRRIDIRGLYLTPKDIADLARAAVCLSAGQCEAFCSEHLEDEFLLFLAHRAPLLRSLSLKFCYGITNEGFAAAITKFPLLEELELELCNVQFYICRAPLLRSLHLKNCSGITNEGFAAAITKFPLLEELKLELCHGIEDTGVFEHVARSCPRMKHIAYIKYRDYDFHIADTDNDWEALAIASMPELRTLQLFRDKLTNTGLASIIDNCPHLESLDIRNCGNIIMDDALRAKCARIKKKTLLLPVFEDCRDDFETGSAISSCSLWTVGSWGIAHEAITADEYIGGDDSASNKSLDSYCTYLGEDEETSLKEYDRVLEKSMRRYKI